MHPQSETIELWCNGNTTDSGPVFPGSSPGSSTEKVERNVRPFSFSPASLRPETIVRPTAIEFIVLLLQHPLPATPPATLGLPRSPSATICHHLLYHFAAPRHHYSATSRLHHSTPPPATFLLHPRLHHSTPPCYIPSTPPASLLYSPPVQPLRDMSLNQHIMPTSGQMLLRSLRDVVAAPFNGYIRSRKECPRLIQQHRLILVTRREVPDQQPSDTGHCSDLGGLLRRRMAA